MVAEGTVNLEKIKEMSYDEAKKELLKLSGLTFPSATISAVLHKYLLL